MDHVVYCKTIPTMPFLGLPTPGNIRNNTRHILVPGSEDRSKTWRRREAESDVN
jgi:hypothetical protein